MNLKEILESTKKLVTQTEKVIALNFKTINRGSEDFKIYMVEKNFKDKTIFSENDSKKNFVVIDNKTAIPFDLITYENKTFMTNKKEVEKKFNNRDYGEFTVTKINEISYHDLLRQNNELMEESNKRNSKIISKLSSIVGK